MTLFLFSFFSAQSTAKDKLIHLQKSVSALTDKHKISFSRSLVHGAINRAVYLRIYWRGWLWTPVMRRVI